MDYLNERLKEPSTWRGLIMIATALGVNISPDLQNAIVSTGLLVAGVVGTITKG